MSRIVGVVLPVVWYQDEGYNNEMTTYDLEALKNNMKLAAGELENNREDSTVGVMNVHENPEGREPGTLDAHWGDNPPEEVEHGSGVLREAAEDRTKMLERVFDGMPQASEVAKDQISDSFAARDYSSHSALLQKKASVLEEPSLFNRVRRLTGRP